jgi:hypothetical protein
MGGYCSWRLVLRLGSRYVVFRSAKEPTFRGAKGDNGLGAKIQSGTRPIRLFFSHGLCNELSRE